MRVAAIDARDAKTNALADTGVHRVQATVLIATNDHEMLGNMLELLQSFPLKTVWAKG